MGNNPLDNIGSHRQPVALMGQSLPGAGTDLLSSDITPIRPYGAFEYNFCPSNEGVLTVVYRKTGEVDRTQKEYGGSTLGISPSDGARYPGEIPVPYGWSVNFQYSGENTGTFDLIVTEVWRD
jgi:hypothetical protein